MDKITKFDIVPLIQSNFVKPYRILYTQDEKDKIWDAVKSHDSVGILIYDCSIKAFILVKQFRPVVYQSQLESSLNKDGLPSGSVGVTYELCAGIVDKDKSLEEIAAEELWEECGYRVSPQRMERVSKLRSSVGILGSVMTLFYVSVNEADRCGSGGGNADEGEMIEVHQLPLAEVDALIGNDDINKSASLLFALLWFLRCRNQ